MVYILHSHLEYNFFKDNESCASLILFSYRVYENTTWMLLRLHFVRMRVSLTTDSFPRVFHIVSIFFPPQSSCLFHAFAFIFALSGNLDIFIWDYLACVRYSSLWSPGSCILFLTSSLALLSFYQMSSIVPPYFTLGCFNYAWMRSASQLHVSIFSLNNCAQNEKSLHRTWEALRCSWVSYGLIPVLWSR